MEWNGWMDGSWVELLAMGGTKKRKKRGCVGVVG